MILLDTHMWIWANLEPEKLPRNLVEVFERDDSVIALSVVSV